jgi:hypothetical protein
VKVSYFPNWHAQGAEGPWRTSPNLMVVVPTSHTVTLAYGATGADSLGDLITVIGFGFVIGAAVISWKRFRTRRRPA